MDRLKQAAEMQKKGQLVQAESIYLNLLKEDPDNTDAKHLLGLIRGEQDREGEAVALIRQAIKAKPGI